MSAAALTLAIAGCSPGSADDGPPTGQGSLAVAASGPMVREGYCGGGTQQDANFRVQVLGIERGDDDTRLKLQFSYVGDEDYVLDSYLFGSWMTFDGFRLVDTIGRAIYFPVSTATVTESTMNFAKGVTYETDILYERLPADSVEVITPCSTGAFQGVPVTDGSIRHSPHQPVAASNEFGVPNPGDTVVFTPPDTAPARANHAGLFSVEDNGDQETATSREEVIDALRTDVLFAVGQSVLSPAAQSILRGVGDDLRANADPALGPVTITGHTDSTGDEASNLALSARRATAVRDFLSGQLPDYRFTAVGKGEADPVANETGTAAQIDQSRARNRRVEIAYKIRQSTGDEPAAGASAAPAGSAPAAAYAVDPGQAVAEREYAGWRLRVFRPYRDGAFLGAAYEITNVSAPTYDANSSPQSVFPPTAADFTSYGALAWVEPGSNRKLSLVRVGQPNPAGVTHLASDDLSASTTEGTTYGYQRNIPEKVYAYYTAPTASTSTVTLDAGPFGVVPGIPIA